jgi:hypothetical protein
MNSTTNYSEHLNQQRQRLEALVNSSEPLENRQSTLVQTLQTLGGHLMRFLTAERELRIWQTSRNGRQVWHAYDPITNRKRQFVTEDDLRAWLDNRYYE